ncbi:WD40 repeat domain-containing serine/threonine protein kinase [Haliangium sp.]|uniref:WD40 repeat domain-containing serine/threonine protein kinase n=1 Tax=Haliangium sp. TaxID=2663208 RepID=UPI003D0A211F
MDSDELSAIQTRSVSLPGRARTPFSDISAVEAIQELAEHTSGPTATPDYDQLPEVLPDAYVRGPELARGGMGRVWAARDRRIGRPVAIKESQSRDPGACARLQREARITGRLQHPSIVPVYEAGTWADGTPFYAMKLVEGESLARLLGRTASLDERLPLLPHLIDAADALAYAHSHRIVHRDLKPANLIIGAFGETMVIDWGLAKDLGDDGTAHPDEAASPDLVLLRDFGSTLGSNEITSQGQALGTPAFMPPEQAQGHAVDERADVYSLGAILYHLLCGQRPYAGVRSSREILRLVAETPPRAIAELAPEAPDELVTIAETAMARDPARRYRSARELAADLKRFRAGKLVSSHHYSLWSLIRRWLGRHRTAVAVAVLGFVALGVVATVSISRVVQERNEATRARTRALKAQQEVEVQRDELLFLQAEGALVRDPTATAAWLKLAMGGGAGRTRTGLGRARDLLMAAVARGVARHVVEHTGWPLDIAFGPDGEHLATVTSRGEISLIDTVSGQRTVLERSLRALHAVAVARWRGGPGMRELRVAAAGVGSPVVLWRLRAGSWARSELSGAHQHVYRLAFVAGGRYLAGWDSSGSVWAWDLQHPAVAPTHLGPGPVAFAPDGGRTVTVEEGAVVVRAWPDGGELARVAVQPLRGEIVVSSDNRRVAAIGVDRSVYLIDLSSADVRPLGRVRSPREPVPLAFSPRGRFLATLSDEQGISLWDVHSGAMQPLRGHDGAVLDLAFSADEHFLLSTGNDRTARFWDLRSGSVRVLAGHGHDVVRGALDPSGGYMATASLDGTVRVWPVELSDGAPVGGHRSGAVTSLGFVGDLTLVTATEQGEIMRWNLAANRSTQVRGPSQDLRVISAAAVGGDQAVLLAGRESTAIERWDAGTGSVEQFLGGPAGATFAAVSGDGVRIAAAATVGSVSLWDRASGVHRTLARSGQVCDLAFAPDGAELAVATAAKVELWRVADGRLSQVLARPGDGYVCGMGQRRVVVYASDGRWGAVAGAGSGLAVWDRDQHELHRVSELHETVLDLAFSPDSRSLVATTDQRAVHQWDTATLTHELLGYHDDLVLDMDFAPDGTFLATAGRDQTIRVWRPGEGLHRVLWGHTDAVSRVAFSPDGTYLVSGSVDGSVRMWEPERQYLLMNASTLRVHLELATSAVVVDGEGPRTPRRDSAE